MGDNQTGGRVADLMDRLQGLEFSLSVVKSYAEVSPERADLQNRIEALEVQIQEVKQQIEDANESAPPLSPPNP